MVRSNFEPGHVPHFVAASLCKKLPKTVPWKVQKAAKAAKPEERTGTSWAKWRNDRDITGYMQYIYIYVQPQTSRVCFDTICWFGGNSVAEGIHLPYEMGSSTNF